jgi:hypothetical protein
MNVAAPMNSNLPNERRVSQTSISIHGSDLLSVASYFILQQQGIARISSSAESLHIASHYTYSYWLSWGHFV